MNACFDIEYPATKKGRTEWNRRYGLNAYWSGKHYAARSKDAEYWHSIVADVMRRQKARNFPFENPVEITILFNDNLDCDNHAAMTKMIIDSMKGRVIHDDNRKWVKSVTMGFHDLDCIRVIVREI